MRARLLDFAFDGVAISWRGPAPFVFVALDEDGVRRVREAARLASYGWGVVPVTARIGGTAFATSWFPRGGGYLLPLKDAVRRAEGIAVGDAVRVALCVMAREDGPPD